MLNRTVLPAILFFLGGVFFSVNSSAQCGGGYTQAQVNWDKLDYYFNSGGNRPYSNYVSNANEQTQQFALGPNYVTIATSSNALVNPGNFDGVTCENTVHTGELTNYTGADVQYNPSSNGQYITLTFDTEVTNLNFTIYDIDRSQRIDVDAWDASNAGVNVNITTQASTILTVTNNNSTNAYVTASSTNLGSSSNQGSATVSISGPVDSVRITITTIGSNAVFYLSDINACVTGSFPTNYNRTGSNEPLAGPVVNQPDYFIITPDNDSVFMLDPVSGKTWFLFTDPSNDFTNSFGYDPYNHWLYYISEGYSINQNNKTLKKYDFETGSISTVLADLTSLNIPTFDYGVESAAACYYNGQLFIGFEGGRYNNSNTRESIVYRLDLNGSGVPINAVQVFAVNSYSGSSAIHDWADFVIQDGVLYNYNSRSGTSMISYEHYDMMTGQSTQYTNPNSGTGNAYQAGLTWAGNQYSFASGTVSQYNKDGTVGSAVTITSAEGLTWQNGAGDASENFRPKCDFGDAPSTYDPVANSPAVHEREDTLRLGPTWDREWVKRGTASTDDVDDALAYVSVMPSGTGPYLVQASVYNNTTSNATVIAWLDYNGNGVFDAAEAITPVTVTPSASAQNIWLYWPSVTNTFSNGDSTYMRIRITYTSAGMTAAHATGYFSSGEVEDYKVLVDDFPLATNLIDFSAVLNNGIVKLKWTASEEAATYGYEVERSTENANWATLSIISANGNSGTNQYQTEDITPVAGISYYRLRIVESSGRERFSDVKKIINNKLGSQIILMPNPASTYVNIKIESNWTGVSQIQLIDITGKAVYTASERLENGSNQIKLNIPETIGNGIYIIKLIAKDEVINEKLIIKK